MLVIAVKGSLMPGESARNSFARNFIQRCEIDDLDVADVPRGERRPGDGRNRLLRASNNGKAAFDVADQPSSNVADHGVDPDARGDVVKEVDSTAMAMIAEAADISIAICGTNAVIASAWVSS